MTVLVKHYAVGRPTMGAEESTICEFRERLRSRGLARLFSRKRIFPSLDLFLFPSSLNQRLDTHLHAGKSDTILYLLVSFAQIPKTLPIGD